MIACISVSSDALTSNARILAELIAPAKPAFVVKSNAYGHGLIDVAKAIEPLASRICVYAFEEAAALREAGISRPIFVMGPLESRDLNAALSADIEIALWDTRGYLHEVAACAAKRNRQFAVHVKINTGVARLGLDTRDARDAIEDYARTSGIRIAGIFSHLAAAEELDSPFTQSQLAQFESVLTAVEPTLRQKGQRPIRHIAASAAAMLWPQTRLDMVRFGIALYGLWPSPQTREAMNGDGFQLIPALSFQTKLIAVRTVEAGTPIGYGCSYHAPKRTRIGVLPLGYADGIPRMLSNRGSFLVAGKRCPVAGRVCMNMTMIDLAAAPNAAAGDTVTLIGGGEDAVITAEDWASWAETINYEIVARLPSHIPRELR